MFMDAAPYGLYTGSNLEGPIWGLFGFGPVERHLLEDPVIHRNAAATSAFLANMRHLMSRDMKEYVLGVTEAMDHHFLVPKTHLQRARLIRQLSDRAQIGANRKERERTEEPVRSALRNRAYTPSSCQSQREDRKSAADRRPNIKVTFEVGEPNRVERQSPTRIDDKRRPPSSSMDNSAPQFLPPMIESEANNANNAAKRDDPLVMLSEPRSRSKLGGSITPVVPQPGTITKVDPPRPDKTGPLLPPSRAPIAPPPSAKSSGMARPRPPPPTCGKFAGPSPSIRYNRASLPGLRVDAGPRFNSPQPEMESHPAPPSAPRPRPRVPPDTGFTTRRGLSYRPF